MIFQIYKTFQQSVCQMVKLLLEKGATMNAFDKKDRRAIHWAAVMGHLEVVRTLVHFGAELSCSDKQVNLLLK